MLRHTRPLTGRTVRKDCVQILRSTCRRHPRGNMRLVAHKMTHGRAECGQMALMHVSPEPLRRNPSSHILLQATRSCIRQLRRELRPPASVSASGMSSSARLHLQSWCGPERRTAPHRPHRVKPHGRFRSPRSHRRRRLPAAQLVAGVYTMGRVAPAASQAEIDDVGGYARTPVARFLCGIGSWHHAVRAVRG